MSHVQTGSGVKQCYRQLQLDGNMIGRTVVAVRGKNSAVADAATFTTYADQTAAIVLIGQAQESLSITFGGYTRSFSTSNFHDAVEPVLRQCGRHQLWWFAAPAVLVPAAGRGIISFDTSVLDRRQFGASRFKSEAS